MNAERARFDVGDVNSDAHAIHPAPYRVEYRINLTLSVSDPQALWTAAAARLLAAPDMTLDDVLDVIGPREDPSINDCIAMLAKPIAMAGCEMDDFWIDRAHDRRAPKTAPVSALDFKIPPVTQDAHGPQPVRRTSPYLALCGTSPLPRDTQTN